MTATTPRLYLSTVGGKWTVIYRGSPLCADTTEERARLVYAASAKAPDPNVDDAPVWDGDAGSFRAPASNVRDAQGGAR